MTRSVTVPRKPRMYLPNIPYHVIQRGNNRDATFFCEEDYQFYLECLYDAIKRYGVKVHAYVLMTNHVHLLMTPTAKESISLTMQSVGRRYVQYINKLYKRTGTLWESRHKASPVDAENYLMICHRYIEMNPVKAKMVYSPAEYRWSSYRCNAEGKFNRLVETHDVYGRLGKSVEERCERYSLLFKQQNDFNAEKRIKDSIEFSVPTGSHSFKEQIERALRCKVGYAHRGRPRIKVK